MMVLQGTPVNIIVGSHVWVEDPEIAWIDGEVTDIKGSDATIVTTNAKTVSFLHLLYQTPQNFISLIPYHIHVNISGISEPLLLH